MSDVREIVLSVLRRVGELDETKTIDGGNMIGEDLGVDSLARIDVVVQIERHLGVVFEEQELVDVRTVDDLCAVVEKTIARTGDRAVAEA